MARLLGFKRWQVMVSFMLESLMIALIGGAAGCLVAYLLADGKSSVSTAAKLKLSPKRGRGLVFILSFLLMRGGNGKWIPIRKFSSSMMKSTLHR